ncbi:MAG: hypothetical protein RIC16_17090 [Rhodospirillales bacterium]
MQKVSKFEQLIIRGLFLWVGFGLLIVGLYFMLLVGHELSPPRRVVYGYVPSLAGAACLFMLWAGHRLRLLVAVNGLAVVGALLMAEAYLQLYPGRLEPDGLRNPLPTELSARIPHSCPSSLLNRHLSGHSGERLLPLTGISSNLIARDVTDEGATLTRMSDKYGFNNPPDSWRRNEVDILIVGDSYAFGTDVRIGEGFSDRLRTSYQVVNLACGGNGPLIELATLKEYGPHLSPPVVVWAYFEGNDLTKNLVEEMTDPILLRYLNGDFSQDLINRQPEIDSVLASYLESELASRRDARQAHTITERQLSLKRLFMLGSIVSVFGFSIDFDNSYLHHFGDIIRQAEALVSSWGGELVFLYLPSEHRYTNVIANYVADSYADRVMNVVSNSGVQRIIDVRAVFADHPDPRSLHDGHYTPTGYRLVAESITDELGSRELKD